MVDFPIKLPTQIPFLSKNNKEKSNKTNKTEHSITESPIEKLSQGMVSVKDVIAPPAIEVDFNDLKISNTYFRTFFVAGYPRFVNANWLSPLINFDHSLDISMFIYPIEGKGILENLKRKIGEMEAEIQTDLERGRIANIQTKVKLEDAHSLQEQLAKGSEKFFRLGLYITLSEKNKKELNSISQKLQSTLGSLMIVSKPATLQMEQAFKSTLPACKDKLNITRNMDTTSLATTFPFTSSQLTANKGVLYGINEHNESLIIFDRFSLENANTLVLAKSGAGKSYMVKLEALRSLMFGTEILVIDPESEYRDLCESVGGEYINFSLDSPQKINPFDLSGMESENESALSQKILSLHALFKIIMGDVSPTEEAILDQALVLTYKQKGITQDPATFSNQPPLLEDLYKVLVGMEKKESETMAAKLERFVKGSLRGVFDQQSSVKLNNPFTVFSTRELEDKLRPVAIFMILDYIWTKIKRDRKKRILIVDEAWYLMQHEDSANFLYSIAKRARKYNLGLTTITQDVEDFLHSNHGKAIITNSSIQILLKQSPAAIDLLAKTFYLSQGEKNLLLSADVGHGIFFAGANHVAMNVVASEEEHKIITSNPNDIQKKPRSSISSSASSQKPTTPPSPTPQPTAKQKIEKEDNNIRGSITPPKPPKKE